MKKVTTSFKNLTDMKITALSLIISMSLLLMQPQQLNAQCGVPPMANPVSISCYGQTGSAEITLNLLGGPYNIQPFVEYSNPLIPFAPYAVNHSGPTYTLNNLSGGTHKIYIIDAGHGGCYDSVIFNINEPGILNFTNLVLNPEECGGTALANFQMSGGTPPYTIQYSNDSLTYQNLVITSNTSYTTNLALGPYSYKLTDNNGCLVDQSHTVFGYTASDQASVRVGLCGILDSSVAYLTSGSPYNRSVNLLMNGLGHFSNELQLLVDFGDNTNQLIQRSVENSMVPVTISHTYANPGIYKVTYTGYNLTTFDSVIVTEFVNHNSDVYPGDANGDGIANNFDLFNIGLGYGSNGPVRTGASLAWVAQPSTDWTQSFNTGLNYKHADCNGDGSIGFSDTTAIVQNYGMSSVLKVPRTSSTGISVPELSIEFPAGTYPPGTAVTIPVKLGSVALPANSIYGIAFTVNYPSSAFDVNTVTSTFANSWVGTYGTNMLAIQKNIPGSSKIDIGISRNDQMSISGNGTICELKVITIDNVSGKLSNTEELITISNVRMIDTDGNLLPVTAIGDTITINGPASVSDLLRNKVKLYPVPAKDFLVVEGQDLIHMIEVYDLTGMLVMSNEIDNTRCVIETDILSTGTYLAKVYFKEGVTTSKIIITD